MIFNDFKIAVQKHFDTMKEHRLLRTSTSGDDMWETYLASFPEGTNPIFRERTEHDCQCCKQFIRNIGNAVAFIDGKLVSIWDCEVGGYYKVVADAMSEKARAGNIDNVYLSKECFAGTDKTRQITDSGIIEWSHFYVDLPPVSVVASETLGSRLGIEKTGHQVFVRALEEVTKEALSEVVDLISQGSLYRGEEHLELVKGFAKLHKQYADLTPEKKEMYSWDSNPGGAMAGIRNSVIGSLLVDLSNGRGLEAAVTSFEAKVAPTNYKRPTALVTKKMVENARAKVDELGYTSALSRRYATIDDITVNNVLFADREAKRAMSDGVFDEVAREVTDTVPKLDKVEEIGIDKFMSDVLSNASEIELMVETRHEGNLFSLVAPMDKDAKTMFKWPNMFSWSYNGELADSVKARVKAAGGEVDGDFRASLAWYNSDDLDISLVEPGGNRIYFGDKRSPRTGGNLDIDMNASSITRNPVENITYPKRNRMIEGRYKLEVYNYTKRSKKDVGFEVEVEFDGELRSFTHSKDLPNHRRVLIAEFEYSHDGGLVVIKSLKEGSQSKEIWGITTQKFHRVVTMMHSPNHWDDLSVGNKHTFFVLEGCSNEEGARGFFNEFLGQELDQHRKVFELVGSKTKTAESEDQLSGLGFSSTQRNYAFVRVTGAFARTIKVLF